MSGVTVATMMSSSSVRADPAPAQRLAGRFRGDRARAGARLDVVALLDPGPRADPLVRGVDQLHDVVVGHDALGDVGPERRDRGPSLAHAAPSLTQPPRHPRVTLDGQSNN
jgi:hypothetical protein